MTERVIARLLSLICIVVATACADGDNGKQSFADSPVALSAYHAQPLSPTRGDAAAPEASGLPDGQHVGVYAYYHERSGWQADASPNFMFNQEAVYHADDEALVYAPLKYWPNTADDRLSFMAYSPYGDPQVTPLLANTGTGLPTFSFTVDDGGVPATDFLVSDLEASLRKPTISSRVRFLFRHATSKVTFRVVVDEELRSDLASFAVGSLGISGIKRVGILTPSYDAGETTLTWAVDATSPTATYSIVSGAYSHLEEPYLLLPQVLSDDARLTISYSLTFRSYNTAFTYAGGQPQETAIYTYSADNVGLQLNELKVTGTDTPLTEWLPNHHYVYTIRLRANQIEFTGQVVDWGEYIWENLSQGPAPARTLNFDAHVLSVGTKPAAAGDPVRTTGTGAGEFTDAMLRQTGFGVYCWYTGTDEFPSDATTAPYLLMRNQRVSYDAAALQPQWTYSPTKYWPVNPADKLTLRAYAPYSNYLVTDATGIPQMPVQVAADDFCQNRQQDPLWGTSKHLATGELDGQETTRYGERYTNYTYLMSGNERLRADERDGVIDWYFHHGMAKLTLEAMVQELPDNTEIRITEITFSPLYQRGLFDIARSRTATAAEKPVWTDCSPNEGFGVTLGYQHGGDSHNDLNGVVLEQGITHFVSDNGLLVIPRDYSSGTPLTVSVTYTETNTSTHAVEAKTVEAKIDFNVQGNTVYALQLLLNVESNSLYIRSFVNLDWQVGSYKLIEL